MTQTRVSRLRDALEAPSSSVRLRAALAAGSAPAPDDIEVLVARCGVEPDFFVRDMLTWALTRHDTSAVVARLLPELGSPTARARAQALHALSKIGRPDVWSAITALLLDEDDEVARTAWRTAAGLVPAGGEEGLARTLATQLGRGDRDTQLSLSRALVALGEEAASVVDRAKTHPDPGVRAHAIATERLIGDPDHGFDAAIADARRFVALRDSPVVRQ
ncbi:HEAT repeat domain-containing protein [Cellulomonas fengjieae]|uniref:HEAT repeat domain-containing protein n=1 Tax=Cellulomonas fengjieae TaxID=2819978 RepID=A0ABS3SJN5_9CELL|nr:HEAT repeat domain-containing protein [Cellulomonas fengjieae]MBO3085961.1 HEAT repeat domain-containing protein [Cellulomonas fengjieae]QVI65968.1 HEAT repeat domain-containing protein [Cellulomonas fengjieae]